MRLALVGNMNNNFFSLMRYLRALGVDAHLLRYRTEHAHFSPAADTWTLERWRPYIHDLELDLNYATFLRASPSFIREQLDGYDLYVGCGPAPIFFYRAGLRLDVFLPYCVGIEIIAEARIEPSRPLRSLYFQLLRRYQILGLRRNTRFCVSMAAAVEPATERAFRRLGVEPLPLGIPMVCTVDEPAREEEAAHLGAWRARLRAADWVVLSHSQHRWRTLDNFARSVPNMGYGNDVLIRGFAEYATRARSRAPLLVLFEYGVDVPHSKRLVSELGLGDRVLWLPKMSRKEIMLLLGEADVGAGEFGLGNWGGVGWEILASGKPLLNYVLWTEESFHRRFGYPLPPILNAREPSDIARRLLECEAAPERTRELGRRSKEWFDRYDGIALARKWRSLLRRLGSTRAADDALRAEILAGLRGEAARAVNAA